jgi:ribosomal protein S7
MCTIFIEIIGVIKMKNTKKSLILSGLLIGALAVSPTVLADTQTKTEVTSEVKNYIKTGAENKAKEKLKTTKPAVSKEQDKANKKAIVDKAKSQVDLLKEVDQGIIDGFKKVVDATKLIQENKEKEAIKALQEATGKFDIALAANPKLGLIPIASTVSINELLTTAETVKTQTKLAKEFLGDSKVQAARALLMPLQDELVTRTTSLPMTTYPDAIKLATKILIEGKKDAAAKTLETALSTFVEEVSVIPLSLLRVQAMMIAASELDKEKDKDKALSLLAASEKQLQVAAALGYTSKSAAIYKDLSDQIAALEKEVKGGNAVEKLYTKLKTSIKDLIGKSSEQKSEKK